MRNWIASDINHFGNNTQSRLTWSRWPICLAEKPMKARTFAEPFQDEVGYAVFRFMRSAMSQIKAGTSWCGGARGRQAERRIRHVAFS
jgi:hypothetical protein